MYRGRLLEIRASGRCRAVRNIRSGRACSGAVCDTCSARNACAIVSPASATSASLAAGLQGLREIGRAGRIVEMLGTTFRRLVEQSGRLDRSGLPGVRICSSCRFRRRGNEAAPKPIAACLRDRDAASGPQLCMISPGTRDRRQELRRNSVAEFVARSGQPHLRQRLDMALRRWRAEAAQHDARDAGRPRRQFRHHRAGRDARGAVGRESIDAGRDRRKGDAVQPVRRGEFERTAIAGGEQRILVALPPPQTGPTAWITCRAFSR